MTRVAWRRSSRARTRPETSGLQQLPHGKGGGHGNRSAAGQVSAPRGAVRSAERTNAAKDPASAAIRRGRERACVSRSVRDAESAAKGKSEQHFLDKRASGLCEPRAPAAPPLASLRATGAPRRARPSEGSAAGPRPKWPKDGERPATPSPTSSWAAASWGPSGRQPPWSSSAPAWWRPPH